MRMSAVATAVLASLTLAAPAGAATYRATVSPDPFTYPATEPLVYRLHITTGSQAERLKVTARAPRFPESGEALRLDEMTLEGPGSVRNRSAAILIADRFCTPVLPDSHGEGSYFRQSSIEVDVPADSTTALVLPASTYGGTGSAPWSGMDLAVEFELGGDALGQPPIRSPSPVNGGRRGVRISFRADPVGAPGGCPLTFTPVNLGDEVLLSGTAETSVAGQLMTLRAVRSRPGSGPSGNRIPEGAPSELARVRVAEDGTFAYRWRPTAAGDYTLGALYQSQAPGLADDFSMPTNLRVGPTPTPTPTPSVTSTPPGKAASPALGRPTAHGRRRGRVVVSTARGVLSGAASRSCSGRITIEARSGARRVGVRHTSLTANCRWRRRYSIRLGRLPRRQRRRLAAGKPITMTVAASMQASAGAGPTRSPSTTYRVKP